MNRLWVKLTLAFLAISLTAVALVAALSSRATGEQFRRYVVASTSAGQYALSDVLVGYYAARGSWEGVDRVLARSSVPSAVIGPGRGAPAGFGPNYALADVDGRVIASRTGELVGEQLPAGVLAQGLALSWEGRPIGTVLNVRSAETVLDPEGETFLQQVRRSLAWAALLAVVLSLLLGVLTSRLLTAPLARLTRAAGAIADGDLSQRVEVRSSDEIGELAGAFNHMATSLTKAEALRRNLVADVAHELRTPLSVVQGNLQAILEGVYPLEMEQIAGLYDETRLLTRLVADLHELALADAGQLRLLLAPVSPVELARAAVAQFTAAAESAGVALRLDADASTPEVEGDADRLAQVLRNLLSNALRHTPAGGSVTVAVRPEGDSVRLDVADTGSGIAPGDLPHVFDRFYRGDRSRARQGGGAGLGLAIARQLILAHAGQISVTSPAGGGATFTVLLPARDEQER